MNRIYSPEPFEDILLNTRGDNGDTIKTISCNRDIKKSSIYIEIKNLGIVRPTVYRGYFDENENLQYYSTTYADIPASDDYQHIVFNDDILNVHNYITYRVEFESLSDDNEVDIDSMGVVFSDFESTKGNTISYSCNLLSDINKKPLSYQTYTKTQSFTMIINRSDFEEVLSIIEKPYYLVNIIDDCIDNSTKKLIETNTSISYITDATKMCYVTITNIVGK